MRAILNAAGETGNLFVDSLDEETREHLMPYLTRVSLRQHDVLYEPGATIEQVLFPSGSVVSVITQMLDGSTVEVGFIGREGTTGLALALGSRQVAQRALVQIPDGGMSMSASDFEVCLASQPSLERQVLRYAQATIAAISQFAACNRLHPVNERFARWLLMAHDRVPDDTIMLTHEFLGQMLGVRRAGVTVAALTLQRLGFIEYSQGRILIRNRAGLEGASCECYLAVEREFTSIMGYSLRKSQRTA
jgi:CRP-like cAMP-binding protein